jgi:hypothetical protein
MGAAVDICRLVLSLVARKAAEVEGLLAKL